MDTFPLVDAVFMLGVSLLGEDCVLGRGELEAFLRAAIDALTSRCNAATSCDGIDA